MTKIGILGAGAMGSYFGALLALAGHDVVLVDVDAQRMCAIADRNLTLVRDGDSQDVRVGSSTSPEILESSDVVIVLTKANTMVDALRGAQPFLDKTGAVVVIPNGLGCGPAAARIVPRELVIHGTTAAGAVLEGDSGVRETVTGTTYLGRLDGPVDGALTEVVDLLDGAGLKCEAFDDVESWIWTKLLINVTFNAVTALTGVKNAALIETPHGERLLDLVLAETTAVADASGIKLHCNKALDYVTHVGAKIAPQYSSMLQDLMRHRPTEVDFLNGAVTAAASELGVPTPVNEALTHLIHLRESVAVAADAQHTAPMQAST